MRGGKSRSERTSRLRGFLETCRHPLRGFLQVSKRRQDAKTQKAERGQEADDAPNGRGLLAALVGGF